MARQSNAYSTLFKRLMLMLQTSCYYIRGLLIGMPAELINHFGYLGGNRRMFQISEMS